MEEQGQFACNGRIDKLAVALDKTERSGRVVGVGAYVTPKRFFDVPQPSKSDIHLQNQQWSVQQQKVSEERDKQVEMLMAKLNELQEQIRLSKTQQYPPYFPQYPQNMYPCPPQQFPYNPSFGPQPHYSHTPQQNHLFSTPPQYHPNFTPFTKQNVSPPSPQQHEPSITRQPQFSPTPQHYEYESPSPLEPKNLSTAAPPQPRPAIMLNAPNNFIVPNRLKLDPLFLKIL